MVLYQEPDEGVIPAIHRKEAGEVGELVVGALKSTEQAGGHRGGALEAGAAWP